MTPEDNERLTRVGPGAPMGELLRRYWQPALLSPQLAEPDGEPVRVRLLGEDLLAFRDSQGRVGLIDRYCPHRLADLFLGRNEECGLRCVYHGWKFDVEGNCVDMPNEPAESTFRQRVHLRSYPTVESGGVVWAYLGPEGARPDPPAMEWLRAPATHRFVSRTFELCNFVQAIEGGIDTVHSSFLHNNNLQRKGLRQRDTAPRLEAEATPYGFRYAGIRDLGEEGLYVRLYQFVLPFHQLRSHRMRETGDEDGTPLIKGHMWVPVDDGHTMVYNWMFSVDPGRPFTPEYVAAEEAGAGRGPDGETEVRHRTADNDWLIDRAVQRSRTYTGIAGLNTQDLAVQESMGPIVDRSREHLGTTDRAIILLRHILLRAMGDLERGEAPPGVVPETYRSVRPTDVIVPRGSDWRQAVEQEIVARF